MADPQHYQKDMPQITPRITPADTLSSENKRFRAPYLGALVNVINALGAFNGEQLTKWQIAHLMYETERKDGQPLNVQGIRVDYDRKAEDQLMDILHDGRLLLQKEVDFFKVCLGRLFGPENVARLDEKEIFSNHPSTVIHKLFSDIPPVALDDLDPLMALIALASAEEEPVEIELRQPGQAGYRNITSERYDPENYDVGFEGSTAISLPGDATFKVFISKEASKIEPLVIQFTFDFGDFISRASGIKIDYRGQVLSNVVATYDETGETVREKGGPWRVTRKGNKPFQLDGTRGRFGILVIPNVGKSLDHMFPSDFDEHALCNDDYRHLFSALANNSAKGNTQKIGVLFYEV